MKNSETDRGRPAGERWTLAPDGVVRLVISVLRVCRECCRFFGEDGLTAKVFFTKVAPFGLLWTTTNYLYLQALRKINTTDVSALFCCNKAFVFLLSWIVLRDRFIDRKSVG